MIEEEEVFGRIWKVFERRLHARRFEHDSRIVEHLADLLHLVVTLEPTQQHVLDTQADGVRLDGVVLAFLETEPRVIPIKQAVDRFLGLGLEMERELFRRQRA